MLWATRGQLIELGAELLRAVREQLGGHKIIPSQAQSPFGCSPVGSPAPQWESLGILCAGMLGCPVGYRQPESSLNVWCKFRQTELENSIDSFTLRTLEEIDSAERQKGSCVQADLWPSFRRMKG